MSDNTPVRVVDGNIYEHISLVSSIVSSHVPAVPSSRNRRAYLVLLTIETVARRWK